METDTKELEKVRPMYIWKDLNDIDDFKVIEGSTTKYEIYFKDKIIRLDDTEILDHKVFQNKFFNEFKTALPTYKNITQDWANLLNHWSRTFLLNSNDAEQLPITDEIKEILQNKNLFNNITEIELDKKIVGETDSRKVLFLCAAGGRLVKNCQVASYNVLVSDSAGVGKDYVTKATLNMLPRDVLIYKSRISPAVFTYWHTAENEPDWTWDGKVFYNEDISETVLNSDVLKVMCSSGSNATIVQNGKAVDLEIVGKPVMMTTTATSVPSPETVRRNLLLGLDGSAEQTQAIMKRHAEFAMMGKSEEYDKKYIDAQEYLRRVNITISFADRMYGHFPMNNLIMRTNFPRFLDYIRASAAFHQYQRVKDEKTGNILAEGEDYDIARECFIKVASNKYMIPLTINQKKILKTFEANPRLKECSSKLHATEMNFMTLSNLIKNLANMVEYGIVRTDAGEDKYGKPMELFSLNKEYTSKDKFNIPAYKDLFPEKQSTLLDNKKIIGAKNGI